MDTAVRHSSHSSTSTSASAASPRPGSRFSSIFSKKRQHSYDPSSEKIYEPQPSDKILSSPLFQPNIEINCSNGSLPSPDSFIGTTHHTEYLQLREHTKRLRKSIQGPDPKRVDQTWEVYRKLREDALQLCKSLLQKSQNNNRNFSSDLTSIGPLDSVSTHSSINETSLPFQINDQWHSAISDYKAAQESILENIRTSLLATYKSYEPEASNRQLEAFLGDKPLRRNLIIKWRDASVHRMKSEKLLFWEQYKIRSLNHDKLKLDVQVTEDLLSMASSGKAPDVETREYVIAKNGDTILEFANAASEIHPILRFRVSSHLLGEQSAYFAKILSSNQQGKLTSWDVKDLPPPSSKQTCKDGMEVKVYKMPQRELNSHDALTILLHAAHTHNMEVPREIDFPVFVSIAEVCLRYRCTSPLEMRVEYEWLPQWMHKVGDNSPDGLLLISYAFGRRGIFTRMSKTAILNAIDENQIQSKESWPQAVRDKIKAIRSAKLAQIYDCCTSAMEEYFRPPQQGIERKASVGSLVLTAVPRCPRGSHQCDATNLGWLMLVYNELRVLPRIMANVEFRGVPKSPRRSIKELVDCLRLMPSAPQVHSGVCDYAPAFRSAINDIYNSIQGLTLNDVSGEAGWTLSKHVEEDLLSPETYELAVPDKEERESPAMSSNEAICLRIFSHFDQEEDLKNAAMIDKGFYAAYKRNEAALLRNIMKFRRRTVSTASPVLFSAVGRSHQTPASPRVPFRPGNINSAQANDLSNVSRPYSPVSVISPTTTGQRPLSPPAPALHSPEPRMTEAEANEFLYTKHEFVIPRSGRKRSTGENDKFLMGDVMHIENKAILPEGAKHLREEKDAALGLGMHSNTGS